jgi:hypothetical protein
LRIAAQYPYKQVKTNKTTLLRLLPLVILVLVTVRSKATEMVLLNKQITYKAKQISLKKALAEIGAKHDIKFSYSESMVPVGNLININVQNKPLSQVLDDILHATVTYKEMNGQVVLMRKKSAGKPTLTISGYVSEKGSGELLLGVNIYVPGTSIGTTTNAYGFYSLSLPKGTYKLAYSYISYETQIIDIELTADKEINITLDGVKEVSAVEIVAESVVKESNKTQMSSIDIPVEQIKEIPALLGEKDVLKVVQLMPGVQKGSEGQSGFYVRGGGPDQNLIILDGAPVYNAFHLFGFFSLFNGDALKSVELIKGGFPARYGGRLSSVLDLHMKEGHKEKYSGEVGIGLISSRFTVEGPLKKNKSSFILSGRRTYIDALMQPFMTGTDKGGYYFYDFNAKVNYDLGKKDKVYLSGYFGKDKFYASSDNNAVRNTFRFEWGNATATARWNHEFSNKLFANASVIFSNYRFLVGASTLEKASNNEFNLRFYTQIRDYAIKYDLDYYPANGHHVKMGVTSTLHHFTPSAVVYKNSFSNENLDKKKTISGFETGLYIEDDMRLTKRFKVNAGMRISHFNNRNKNYINPEPRIATAYQINKDMAAKASFAVMNQYMHLVSNTGIGLPTDLWVPATSSIPPQRSMQIAGGLVKDFPKQNLAVTVEGYYKKMNNILSYKEGATFLVFDDPTSADNYSWEENVTSGQGWSYGAEFLVQKKKGRFSGWIGYTLSWTQLQFDELNFGKKFWARYDRRHDISVVGIYKITKNVSVSATWVYGTGQAITLPRATYTGVLHDPTQGYLTNNTSTTELVDYGEKNNFRMAPYHRMDLGIRADKVREKYTRTIEFSFYNVYNRKNPFFYYTTTENGITKLKQISLFPIIPSISLSYKF